MGEEEGECSGRKAGLCSPDGCGQACLESLAQTLWSAAAVARSHSCTTLIVIALGC